MIRLLPDIRLIFRWLGISTIGFIMLACAPKYDWREVRHDDAKWKALFPAKPVEVSRALSLPESKAVVTLTLRSAKIDDNLFAVGWIPNTAKSTVTHLETAMLANISARPETIQRNTIESNGQVIQELRAKGKMRANPKDVEKDAMLWMRTVVQTIPGVNNNPATTQVIEIIALGPTDTLSEADAELFVKSLTLLP